MSKRFTDTTKWTNNKWFFNLTIQEKLFWIYLCDNCDAVGVWEENIELASIIIGYEYSIDTLLKAFSKQVHVFANGRKWYIRNFCNFQYNTLYENSPSKPVLSYVLLLKKHGLWQEYLKGIDTLKDIDKDKDKDKEQIQSEKKQKFIPPVLEEVKDYFKLNGYKEESAIKAFNYYDVASWKDRDGKQIRNWKQKMQGVWFKDENKEPQKVPLKW